MKRDECLHNCKRISQHDAAVVSQFRIELGLLDKLVREGHTQECAKGQLWAEPPESCTCKALEGGESLRQSDSDSDEGSDKSD